jgi:hypothetical protein
MKPLRDYIMVLNEGVNPKVWEDVGYTIYTNPDGITHYALDSDAPEEAHHLASAAAMGDPEATDEISGIQPELEDEEES